MLLDTLAETSCDTLYIKGRQCNAKQVKEEEHRKRIIELAARNTSPVYRKVRRDLVMETANDGTYREHTLFGDNTLNYINHIDLVPRNIHFYQPATWLYHAAQIVDPERHSVVQVAYITGDQAPVIRTELEQAFEFLQRIMRPTTTPVPLRFPLIWKDKSVVLNELHYRHEWVYPHIWYCESPSQKGEEYFQCGCCDACRKHRMYYHDFCKRRQFDTPLSKDTSTADQ